MKPKHYPSMDMYNDAVQHPGTAFLAPDLRQAEVATSALGLPVALGGGFALTYRLTVGGRVHAVRCLHRYVADLEERYRKIAACLAGLPGDYFVDFEYLSQGIRVQGEVYPVVRMRWAEGDTLGAFLEEHYDDVAALRWLRRQFRSLDAFLRRHGLAHGDLQNGNLIIDGQNLRVVDYDGMFVPGMKEGVGHEIGHRHFQHPDRRPEDFGPAMDRFSLIVLDVSLQALEQDKSLFHRYSNGENVLFSANDLADPPCSPLFRELLARPELKSHAEHLAAIAQADLAATPTLPEFLRGENIPAAEARLGTAANAYLAAFPVVDTRDFEAAQRHVGDRVELVGRIADVAVARNKFGRPYAILGFGEDRGRGISINIWAQGLAKLRQAPDRSWIGQWLSVTGLVDPGTVDPKLNLRHVCITVGEASQLRIVTEAEAQYRLASRGRPPLGRVARRQNQAILASLRGRRNGASAQGPAPAGRSRGPAAPGIRANGPGAAAIVPSRPPTPGELDETTIAGIPLWIWVTAIFVSLLVLAIV